MRVVLPFKLDGQTLIKGRNFPKSVADGSKDSIVIKVDGIPDGCTAKGYFKLSWESDTIYDLTFDGDELVVDEYIITLPAHADNKYIDYKFSFSVAIWEGDVERLTTNPVEVVVEKSNYSDETTNTPDIPESQYGQLANKISGVAQDVDALKKSGALIVTTELVQNGMMYEMKSTHSALEIYQRAQNGGAAVLNWMDGSCLPLSSCNNEAAVFSVVTKDDSDTVATIITIDNNKGWVRSRAKLDGDGGVSGVVVSTSSYDFAVTDKDGKAAISVGLDDNGETTVDFIGKNEAVTVYNVTFNHPLESGYYTLATAISAVPTKLRKPGLIVTFRSSATKWDSYQYTVAMTSNSYWNNLSYWQNNSQISTPEADEESGLKWCAMGDSITEGWYSYYDADGNAASTPKAAKGWASQVATINGYELTNEAKGGTGYVCPNGTPAVNGRDIADAIDFAGFDFVTIAYGVNDWKGKCVLGSMDDDISTGNSIYSNMRYIIEKIMTDNPLCKIIVITPINCCVQGEYDTNWGLGYAYSNNGTLEQIFDALVEVCEWYGIEYIDMTHNSVVNRQNIEQLLIDKVHPSEACHKVMALELSKKIMF